MSTYVHNNDTKVIFHLPTSKEKNGEREREQVPEFLYFRQLNTFDYARIQN